MHEHAVRVNNNAPEHGPGARDCRRWLVIACLILSSAGILSPAAGTASPQPDSFSDLQRDLLAQKPGLDRFRTRGPFAVTESKNRLIRLSAKENIRADLYLAAPADKAPLVILLHGHDSSKEAHALQAMHLASWGMHALSVQLSKTGPWNSNGRTLAGIVHLIHRSPGVLDHRIDAGRIILAGHSFGGYAVAVAMAQNAPVAGGVLLDAAVSGNATPDFMQKIRKPVMLLGADEELSPVRYREYFYHYIPAPVVEVSVRNATHEDAQYPSEDAVQNNGVDPDVTEALQITFAGAMTAAAFSIAVTGKLDYAWMAFAGAIRSGQLSDAKMK